MRVSPKAYTPLVDGYRHVLFLMGVYPDNHLHSSSTIVIVDFQHLCLRENDEPVG